MRMKVAKKWNNKAPEPKRPTVLYFRKVNRISTSDSRVALSSMAGKVRLKNTRRGLRCFRSSLILMKAVTAVLMRRACRMRSIPAIAVLVVTAVAGCVAPPPRNTSSPSIVTDARAANARESSTPRQDVVRSRRPVEAESAPSTLPAYEVRESAFSDFGMSVKTNFEVKWGGKIEWMVVTAVAEGSSASRMGVAAGDRVLAIDGRQITEMDRDAMLDAFFQRKKGDRSRFLMLGERQALPRFVILAASRPGS